MEDTKIVNIFKEFKNLWSSSVNYNLEKRLSNFIEHVDTEEELQIVRYNSDIQHKINPKDLHVKML